MPKYTVVKDEVYVIGTMWLPAITAAQTYTLREHDLENIRDEDGKITRESIEGWVLSNTGDFQSITDFSADFGSLGIVFDWGRGEESQIEWEDCHSTYEENDA